MNIPTYKLIAVSALGLIVGVLLYHQMHGKGWRP